MIIGIVVMLLATENSYAQLLEDRNKLKTHSKKREGFSPFKKRIKKSKAQGKPSVVKADKPKFSKNVAGDHKARKINPKFSKPQKSKSRYAVQPRYSRENAGQSGRGIKVNPRYSQNNAGQSKRKFKVSPRYSQENAGQVGRKWKISPRFTQEHAGNYGRSKKIQPRFSQQNAGQISHKMSVNPRFTQEHAGNYGRQKKIQPRFSQQNAGQISQKMSVNPRFTQEHAGNYGRQKKIQPRFSQQNSGQISHKMKVSPRFTQENAGEVGHKIVINPRFTQENAGQVGHKIVVNPRFTQNNAGEYKKKNIKPRFSKENAGEFGHGTRVRPRYTRNNAGDVPYRKVSPRYSIPPDYAKATANNQKSGFLTNVNLIIDRAKYKKQPAQKSLGPKTVKPTYSQPNTAGQHNESIKSYKKQTDKSVRNSPNYQLATYTGKVRKLRKTSDMHPSARHLSAKGDDSRIVRDTKRKLNVSWVRMFGNQTQPDAVKDKVGKAKFDKDEKDIWNN
ncbi:hypothetical protein KO526_14865 [Reichenbachiella agariperforans]|nr:hypothetical protein [Reichenbachiella agariperforans]